MSKSAAAKTVAGATGTPMDVELPELAAAPEPPKRTGLAALYADDMPLMYYDTPEGVENIPLPTRVDNPPDMEFLWELHQYKGRPDLQLYEYMDRFGVPKAVQRHAVQTFNNSFVEFINCGNAWMQAIGGGATLGE